MAELKIKKWPTIGVLLPEPMKKDLSRKVSKNRETLPPEDDRCSLSGYVRLLIRRDVYGSDEPTPSEKEYHKLREQGVIITEELGKRDGDEGKLKFARGIRDWKSKINENAEALRTRLLQRAYTAVELANEMALSRQYILQILRRMKPRPDHLQIGSQVYYTLGPAPVGVDPTPKTASSSDELSLPLEDIE